MLASLKGSGIKELSTEEKVMYIINLEEQYKVVFPAMVASVFRGKGELK